MCTLTIHRSESSLLMTMNRDERRVRGPEEPPRMAGPGPSGVSWLGPRDSDSGGTWAAFSDHGLAACLLNRYQPGDSGVKKSGAPSRGEIIPALLEHVSFMDAMKWLNVEFDPRPYPSFLLITASMEGVVEYGWDGTGKVDERMLEGEWEMVTSSSWCGAEVLAWRGEKFRSWLSSGMEFSGTIPGFNLLRLKGHEEWCPMMSRDYARTRSVTQLEINKNETAEIRYWTVKDGDPLTLDSGTAQAIHLQSSGG